MAPPEIVLSSGSVVFALPHIREAIFFYHAPELVKDRKAQLDAIARPVTDAFWDSFKELESDEKAEEWFARRLDALISGTNFLAVAKKLGLQLASYVEFLASRRLDVQFWLTACSVLGNSRKWEGQGRYHLRLEAHPRELKSGANVHEEPGSNPAQMLWHANGYDSGYMYHRYEEWADMEGLSHVLRDDIGRVFVMRLLNLRRQPFIFTAAASRPEIIFSEDSPFLPIHEILEYNESQGLGAIIYQAPPCPLGPYLLPDCGRDELRRILERAHDCFFNLATLGRWGISLNTSFQHKWTYPITTQDEEPFMIPAYFQKTLDVRSPGKLRREGHYEERLPAAPRTAWPVSPLGGKGGIAGLPWSQITAYNDPRVPGPRIFFHNVVKANLSDADYEAVAARSPYRWQRHLANDRHHDDLLIVARDLLDRFMGNIYGPRMIEVLRSSALSSAYEQCLLNGVDAGPPGVEQGHSGLFRFCANCALGWGEKTNVSHAYDTENGARCPTCGCSQMVTAVPDALRHLLLRIMEPEVREDGSKIAVTAQEAHETMKSVMATEIPRLQQLYDDWVEKQPKVKRIDTAGPLPLDKINRDVSSARWSMFEMLRGNHLDARFRRADHIKLRDAMRAFHAEKKKREEEQEAKRRGIVAANTVGAPQREEPSCSASETPNANAMEMLWYARERYYYHNRMRGHYGPEWSDLDGFAHLLRDDMGHLFVLRLLDISRHQFPFKMARERPDIIYSESSCLYPIHEIFEYSASIGAIITRCPPWPLCSGLLPNSGRDELRRVLEFAHDVFGILTQLEDCQASLKDCHLDDSWEDVFSTSAGMGPWLIPAYLQKEKTRHGQKPSKLTRSDNYIEQLPPPPSSAWPLAPLSGSDGIAGLPWCQLTAYNDPRVPGPKTYLYGLTNAIFSDNEYTPQRRRWVDEVAAERFRADLLDGVVSIVARLCGPAASWKRQLRLLQSPKTSIAYEECLRDGPDNGPREPSSGHSGLFMSCINCILGYGNIHEGFKGKPGHCRSCGSVLAASAMPESFRLLLLRIVEPTVRADGSKEMVKAKEALAEMKRINATEIPRLEKVYHAWVDNQKKVKRMTTAGPLPLDKIRADVSAPRWMLLEMLRGNLLNSRFRKKEFIDLRDTVKSFLAEREAEKKKLEGGSDEEAGTVDAPSKASAAATPASEEGVAALLSAAAPESVKRSTEHADDDEGATKKRKAA